MKNVIIAGANGLIGSSLVKLFFETSGYNVIKMTRSEVDLTSDLEVRAFLADKKGYDLILAAGKVGCIKANNSFPAEFIYENLMINLNVIHNSYRAGINKLVYLASSCIYP